MPRAGEMTLDQMRKETRRILNVRDTATGQWGDLRLDDDLNKSQLWLAAKLLKFRL